MRRFLRSIEPNFLGAVWERWGTEWEARRANNPAAIFHWHEIGGVKVNQKLMPYLKAQTQEHCSFCDNFPVSPPSLDTIEHFRPKALFPRDAYRWSNLYFCCMHCQQKGEDFNELALNPDAADFEFDRYFRWDYTRGTIEINEQGTPEDRSRASFTIRFFRLNEGHPSLRRRELRRRSQGLADPLDEFAYRSFVAGPA